MLISGMPGGAAWPVAIQPDGKIVATGWLNNGVNDDLAIAVSYHREPRAKRPGLVVELQAHVDGWRKERTSRMA